MKQKHPRTFTLALLALAASHAATGCHEGAATTPTAPPPTAPPPTAVPSTSVPPSAPPAEPSAPPGAPSAEPSAAPPTASVSASASASAGPASSIVPLGSARRDPLEVLRAHCKQWMAGPEQMEDWQKVQCQAIVGGAPPGK